MEIRCLLLKEDNYKNKTQDSMNNVFSFICLFIQGHIFFIIYIILVIFQKNNSIYLSSVFFCSV